MKPLEQKKQELRDPSLHFRPEGLRQMIDAYEFNRKACVEKLQRLERANHVLRGALSKISNETNKVSMGLYFNEMPTISAATAKEALAICEDIMSRQAIEKWRQR